MSGFKEGYLLSMSQTDATEETDQVSGQHVDLSLEHGPFPGQ
jgi:hypothetical protein